MFCTLFSIVAMASGLSIMSPTINNEQFSDIKNLNYSIANFGHVPYGKKMNGQLYLPPIQGAKDEVDWRFCDNPKIETLSTYYKAYGDKWLIVRRGDCPFTKKAINAQIFNAKLLIVVDNKDEQPQSIMMADDGNGYQIDIPSILISQSEGEKIIKYLQEHPNSNLVGTIDFALNKSRITTDVIFGLNIESRDTFKLLTEFRPIYNQLKESINLTIYYEVLRCFSCEKQGWKSDIEDCLGGGRYCQYDPNGEKAGNGADVIREQLRQTCLWQIDSSLWWEYMDYFSFECNQPQAYKNCMDKKIDKKIMTKVEQCVGQSYNESETNQTLATNTILEKHFLLRYSTGIIFYPGASINNQAYRGNIEAFEIKEAICSSLIELPDGCINNIYINPIYEETRNSYFWLIVVVVISSTLFILFIVFVFRRQMKRNMEKDIKDQVSQQLSQYVQFYESRAEK